MASDEVPSLYDWAGGSAALEALFQRFYEHVKHDALLGPIFAAMDPQHHLHVAAFVAEVFSGPHAYSEAYGGHAAMIRKHLGRHLSELARKRWMTLLLETADELGVPTDPEFRSALVGYLEWGSRLAVINSQPGVAEPSQSPMPVWSWGAPGGPYVEKTGQ
jgi:hemoglobin